MLEVVEHRPAVAKADALGVENSAMCAVAPASSRNLGNFSVTRFPWRVNATASCVMSHFVQYHCQSNV